MACEVKGDSDLYGLGVRLGLYLTGVSCVLKFLFVPRGAEGLASGMLTLLFSINLGMLKNVLQGRPAMLEMYIMAELSYILISMLVFSGAMFNGVSSVIASVVVFAFQMIASLWVAWNKRLSGLDSYPPGCARTVRFFGAVDVTGPFGTFLAVILLINTIMFAIYLLVALAIWMFKGYDLTSAVKTTAKIFRVDKEGSSKGFRRFLVRYIFAPTLIFALSLSIWFTEGTLQLSDVRVESSLLNTGQLLPFVVGLVTVLSVISSWLKGPTEST